MTPIPVPQTSLLICQYSSSPPLLPPTNIPSQLKFKREVFEVSIKKILIHAKRFIMEKKNILPTAVTRKIANLLTAPSTFIANSNFRAVHGFISHLFRARLHTRLHARAAQSIIPITDEQ